VTAANLNRTRCLTGSQCKSRLETHIMQSELWFWS